ncbi:MAG: hypothetical protein K8I03_08490 [Ignavibacteria bacterium]|nr:hypothetical protein [Ignavibacteria bacterium]
MEKIEIRIPAKEKSILGNEHSYFDAVITMEDNIFCSLCIELNVASEGETVAVSKSNLVEAVRDYLELSISNDLPFERWVPDEDNPLKNNSEIVDSFKIEVDMNLFEYA